MRRARYAGLLARIPKLVTEAFLGERPTVLASDETQVSAWPYGRVTRAHSAPLEDVANTSGVTATALRVWLQSSHPTMPNIILEPNDLSNVVAYILSLKN